MRIATILFMLLFALVATTNAEPANRFEKLLDQNDRSIFAAPFTQAASTDKTAFEQLEGFEIGLTKAFQYGIRDYTDPFWIGRGTASGDYDHDGWQDIVFGTNNGVALYRNLGGTFELQSQSNTELQHYQIYAVALVDMNNDGWLDLFFTTFNKGNHIALNKQGAFDFKNLVAVPNNNAVLTLSPALGDLDGNGYLDVVNGNVALGVITGFYHMSERRNNSVVFSDKLRFREAPLETTSGETMASLISDVNNDDILDIYFGNDFIIPDKILLGTGAGFTPVTGNQFIPFTPFFSMGADTGDINNDLTLDFVITGTMYMAPFVGQQPIDGKSVAEYSEFKGGIKTCATVKDPNYRESCQKIRGTNYIEAIDFEQFVDVAGCGKLTDAVERDICLTRIMWKLVRDEMGVDDCKSTFSADAKLREVCEVLKLRTRRYDKRDLYGAIPQDDRNMLYAFDGENKVFRAVTEFKHPGGWTWNSKIVDLDNDGWQDIVTSDGTVRKSDYGWNVLMKNIEGQRFEQQQFSAGIAADFGLYSFVLIDMDNDGDLDIIGNGAEGPPQIFRNHSSRGNHSLAVSLVDHVGNVNVNVNGIGAKITLHYNDGKNAQLREIKAGGGYMSFDSAIAYFGLGNTRKIDEIRVLWPDKTQSVYRGPFDSGRHYRIERKAAVILPNGTPAPPAL